MPSGVRLGFGQAYIVRSLMARTLAEPTADVHCVGRCADIPTKAHRSRVVPESAQGYVEVRMPEGVGLSGDQIAGERCNLFGFTASKNRVTAFGMACHTSSGRAARL